MEVRHSLWFVAIGIGLAASVRAQDRFLPGVPGGNSMYGALGSPSTEPPSRAPEIRLSIFDAEPEEQRAPKDEIETDRDSFTPATTLVTPERFLLESAYTFIDNRRTFDTHSFPEGVLRYGVTAWFEARLQWNYEVGGAGNTVSAEAGDEEFSVPAIERESQLGYGFKLKLTEQERWIPESALLAVGYTPTSGLEHVSSFVGTYVWGWTLPRRWKLDAAIRYSADSIDGDGHNLWAPSIVLKVPVSERINIHAEYFGIFTTKLENDSNAQYFSPGMHYLLSEDFEVGFRLGWGLNDDAARFFVNAGIGWRY